MSIFAKKNEITYERACQGDRSRNSRYNSDDLSLTLVHNPYTYDREGELLNIHKKRKVWIRSKLRANSKHSHKIWRVIGVEQDHHQYIAIPFIILNMNPIDSYTTTTI